MSTSILAVGTTEAVSSTFTVVAGTPVTIGLFITGGGVIPSSVSAEVEIEDPGATFSRTGVELSERSPSALIVAPGLYRVRRYATSGVSVGIFRS